MRIVDEERVFEHDEKVKPPKLPTVLVTPEDVLRWIEEEQQNKKHIEDVVVPLIQKHGASALIEVLSELGIIIHERELL